MHMQKGNQIVTSVLHIVPARYFEQYHLDETVMNMETEHYLWTNEYGKPNCFLQKSLLSFLGRSIKFKWLLTFTLFPFCWTVGYSPCLPNSEFPPGKHGPVACGSHLLVIPSCPLESALSSPRHTLLVIWIVYLKRQIQRILNLGSLLNNRVFPSFKKMLSVANAPFRPRVPLRRMNRAFVSIFSTQDCTGHLVDSETKVWANECIHCNNYR